ncbi:helix-turn-helix domain-containing protein [Burkholderia sp. PU8-34]
MATRPPCSHVSFTSTRGSFEDLLIDVRMHHAMMLVQTTTWGIARVAEASGYKSRAHFTERFQECFGYLPSTVR